MIGTQSGYAYVFPKVAVYCNWFVPVTTSNVEGKRANDSFIGQLYYNGMKVRPFMIIYMMSTDSE
jgi:hypothetical protein